MARENALNCTTGNDQAVDINAMASELVENSDLGMQWLTYSIVPILAVTRHGFKLAARIAIGNGGL
jgi:hypothetical protein